MNDIQSDPFDGIDDDDDEELDEELQAEVDAVMACHAGTVSSALLGSSITDFDSENASAWASVLGYYRVCLKDLGEKYGLPGDYFSNAIGLIPDPGSERLLGDLPEMS